LNILCQACGREHETDALTAPMINCVRCGARIEAVPRRMLSHRTAVILLIAVVLLSLAMPPFTIHPESMVGPPHRALVERLVHGSAIPRALSAYSAEHMGQYPDSFSQLAPEWIPPTVDAVELRRRDMVFPWGEKLVHLGLGTVLVWLIVASTRPRGRLHYVAIAYSVFALSAVPVFLWMIHLTPPSYTYLERYAILPGLQEPIPYDVPLAWLQTPYPFTGPAYFHVTEPRIYTPDTWTVDGNNHGYDLARVDGALRSPSFDGDRWLSLAERGDSNALVVLALRRDAAVGDALFKAAQTESGVNREVALWGLYLHRDPRARTAAESEVRRQNPHRGSDYATRLLKRLDIQGVRSNDLLQEKP
jgi:hypothetical protein